MFSKLANQTPTGADQSWAPFVYHGCKGEPLRVNGDCNIIRTFRSISMILSDLLDYNPETGLLRWKSRPVSMFKTQRSQRVWNSKHAGKTAINYINVKGYRCGSLFGKQVRAHRVIWELVTGEIPVEVDHEDGNPSNNRWVNLRNVTPTQNSKNSKRYSNNVSGTTGVYYNGHSWIANICLSGKTRYLGSFLTIDAAISARKVAEITHNFHKNHGRTPTGHVDCQLPAGRSPNRGSLSRLG